MNAAIYVKMGQTGPPYKAVKQHVHYATHSNVILKRVLRKQHVKKFLEYAWVIDNIFFTPLR